MQAGDEDPCALMRFARRGGLSRHFDHGAIRCIAGNSDGYISEMSQTYVLDRPNVEIRSCAPNLPNRSFLYVQINLNLIAQNLLGNSPGGAVGPEGWLARFPKLRNRRSEKQEEGKERERQRQSERERERETERET